MVDTMLLQLRSIIKNNFISLGYRLDRVSLGIKTWISFLIAPVLIAILTERYVLPFFQINNDVITFTGIVIGFMTTLIPLLYSFLQVEILKVADDIKTKKKFKEIDEAKINSVYSYYMISNILYTILIFVILFVFSIFSKLSFSNTCIQLYFQEIMGCIQWTLSIHGFLFFFLILMRLYKLMG